MISRESFGSASEETKLLLIYDMLVDHNSMLSLHMEEQARTVKIREEGCHARFRKLEKRKMFNTTMAGVGGTLGGVLAIWAKFNFWK